MSLLHFASTTNHLHPPCLEDEIGRLMTIGDIRRWHIGGIQFARATSTRMKSTSWKNTLSPNRLRLTKKTVDSLIASLKEGGPRGYWDAELPGFYLQFTPAGSISYCVRYVKPCASKGDHTIGKG